MQEGFVLQEFAGGAEPVEAQLAKLDEVRREPWLREGAPPPPLDSAPPMLHTALASYIQPPRVLSFMYIGDTINVFP